MYNSVYNSEGGNAWKSYGAAQSTKFGMVQLQTPLIIFRRGAQNMEILAPPSKIDSEPHTILMQSYMLCAAL